MIKAILIIHVWSLIVAALAWGLSRFRQKDSYELFPDAGIWLGLFCLCLFSGLFSLIPMSAPENFAYSGVHEAFQSSSKFIESPSRTYLNMGEIYLIIAAAFMVQTFWRWFSLQRLSVSPTPDPQVYISDENIPPLTRSWPRRAIIVPVALIHADIIIRHEKTHLRHNDAELTLLLLLIRDFFWRAPGMSYLIRQWRLAIELRADSEATEQLSPEEKQDYAQLLLSGLKPSAFKKGGKALPCPTAHLTSTRHRSVKMRLRNIIEEKPYKRKKRWNWAIALAGLGTVAFAYSTAGAQAGFGPDGIDQSSVKYVKRIPPKMPAKCLGLDTDTIKIESKPINLNGSESYQHVMTVGYVVHSFDIRRDGKIHNIRIVESNDPCFEPHATAALQQWLAEPQSQPLKNVSVKQTFQFVGGEDHADLDQILEQFLH